MDAPQTRTTTLIEWPALGPLTPDTPWGPLARAFIQDTRERLLVEHRRGASGTAVVQAYTAAIDHMMCELFTATSDLCAERFSRLGQGCALVPQGGYGRGELNPQSDLDFLFLCERSQGAFIENVVERFVSVLFDTNVPIGNAMRTIRECVTLASGDLKVRTSLLDTRFLCGDRKLYDDFVATMQNGVFKQGADRFYREKMQESAERHARFGDSVYLLEPQLKDGEGGLRDLHTALWLARIKFKTNKLDELVVKGVINERERREVEQARDFLWKVRNSLHFLTRQHQDQLRFEYQDHVAAELGFEDGRGLSGVEKFMRAYYLAAASVHHFGEQIAHRCAPEPNGVGRLFGTLLRREIRPGVIIASGQLSLGSDEILRQDPTNFLRLFSDAQRHRVEMSNGTRRLLRASLHLIDDEQRRSPAMAAAFMAILQSKHGIFDMLYAMHRVGVLGAYVPEFGDLLCLVVRDMSHIYTVDQHTLRTIGELEALNAGVHKEMVPLLTSVVREVERLDLVYLALLLHDSGKGLGGEHCARGAKRVPAVAARLHLNEDEAATVEFLVAAHLDMSGLARTRDLHDEAVTVAFAKRLGSPENLRMLFVMTYSDMRGVAPRIWNKWHEMLLSELYHRTLDIFERGAFDVEAHAARVRRVHQRVLDAVPPSQRERAEAFIREMPDRYFLGTNEPSIVHHVDLVGRMDESGLVTEVRHEPEREFTEFTVITRDRPGLFAKLAGVLLVSGMDVLGASINTGRSGLAVDIFRIGHHEQVEVALRPSRWERMLQTLRRVVVDGEDVAALVAAANPPQKRRWQRAVPTEVEINNDISDHFTVLDVNATDRAGALFAIANVLYQLGLSIFLAKITTNVDRILDVFYVTDEAGEKVTDPERMAAIRAAILAVLP